MIDELFEQDEHLWIESLANKLSKKEQYLNEVESLTLQHFLIEMGNAQKAEIENRLTLLTMHILKARYQSHKATRSWYLTIREQRRQLLRFLLKSKNLTKHAESFWPEAYSEARIDMHYETGFDLDFIPKTPEITFEQVLDPNWVPKGLEKFQVGKS